MHYVNHFLLIAFVIVICGSNLMGQPVDNPTTNQTTNKAGQGSNVEAILQSLSTKYIPQSGDIKGGIDLEKEKEDYQSILKILDDIETGLLPRLMEQAEAEVKIIDVQLTNRKNYLIDVRVPFDLVPVNYHKQVSHNIKNSFILIRILNYLSQIDSKMVELSTVLPLVGVNATDTNKTIYRIKNLKGLMLILRANQHDFRRAVFEYQYLLGKNPQNISYINNDETKVRVYNILASCYHTIYVQSRPVNQYVALDALQNELYNLWQAVLIKTQSVDTKLRDYYLTNLLSNYLKVIDYNGGRYKQYYKDYVPANLKGRAQQNVDADGPPVQTTPENTEGFPPTAPPLNK